MTGAADWPQVCARLSGRAALGLLTRGTLCADTTKSAHRRRRKPEGARASLMESRALGNFQLARSESGALLTEEGGREAKNRELLSTFVAKDWSGVNFTGRMAFGVCLRYAQVEKW